MSSKLITPCAAPPLWGGWRGLFLDVKASGAAISILSNYFGWDYTLSCEKLGECDMDTTISDSTAARKATHKTTLQQFLDAQNKLNHERDVNKIKGISSVLSIYKQGLSIAPNPAQDYTTITCQTKKQTKQAYILLTDVTGKVLQKIQVQTNTHNYRLETGNYAKGFYHVCLYEDNAFTDCKKLIIN